MKLTKMGNLNNSVFVFKGKSPLRVDLRYYTERRGGLPTHKDKLGEAGGELGCFGSLDAVLY